VARALFAAAAVGLPVGASAGDDGWSLASTSNGAFTVETPCDAADLAQGARVPDSAVNMAEIVSGSRVLCRKGSMLFVAGLLDLADTPAGATAFDLFAKHVRDDPTREGTPSELKVDGRRLFVNRQESSNRLAQVGFVEISRTKLVFAVAGADGSGTLAVEQQRRDVDRF
jgi:hypothetical protein